MNRIKTSLVVMALLLLTACGAEEIEYTKLDLKDNQELIEKIINDFEANKNPTNIDRKNYQTAKEVLALQELTKEHTVKVNLLRN